jgi:hypothetical protein
MIDAYKLTTSEKALLSLVRSGGQVDVLVRLRDGNIDMIELCQSVDPTEPIGSALGGVDFADLIIKKRDGKVVEQTLRRLLKMQPT